MIADQLSTDALRQLRHEAERARQALAEAIEERDELPSLISSAILRGEVSEVRELRARQATIADEITALEVVSLKAAIGVERCLADTADATARDATKGIPELKERVAEAQAVLDAFTKALTLAERRAAEARMTASGRRERCRVLGSKLAQLRRSTLPAPAAAPVVGDPAGQGVHEFNIITGDDRARRSGGVGYQVEVRTAEVRRPVR